MAEFFHTQLKVSGTKTFRLAACKLLSAKDEDGYGGNSQNQPDEARRAYVPRHENYSFIQDDLEGAEAVAVAILVRDGAFRDLVRLAIKPHCFIEPHLFSPLFVEQLGSAFDYSLLTPKFLHAHEKRDEIIVRTKALKVEYDLSKRTVHGYNYGMSWDTHRKTVLKGTQGRVVLSAAEAQRQLAVPAHLFPEIREMQMEVEQIIRAHGVLTNLFGESVRFIGRYTPNLARTGISWRFQSTVGQCSNIAMTRIQQHIERYRLKWHLLNQIHDAVLVEAPDNEALDAAHVMKEAMRFNFVSPVDGWEATIGVETQIGKNWGKYDKNDNPLGMKVVKI